MVSPWAFEGVNSVVLLHEAKKMNTERNICMWLVQCGLKYIHTVYSPCSGFCGRHWAMSFLALFWGSWCKIDTVPPGHCRLFNSICRFNWCQQGNVTVPFSWQHKKSHGWNIGSEATVIVELFSASKASMHLQTRSRGPSLSSVTEQTETFKSFIWRVKSRWQRRRAGTGLWTLDVGRPRGSSRQSGLYVPREKRIPSRSLCAKSGWPEVAFSALSLLHKAFILLQIQKAPALVAPHTRTQDAVLIICSAWQHVYHSRLSESSPSWN